MVDQLTPRTLTVDEVRARLGVSTNYIYLLQREGKIRGKLVNRRWQFDEASVLSYKRRMRR
jgi:excisionase family DNA binding protein